MKMNRMWHMHTVSTALGYIHSKCIKFFEHSITVWSCKQTKRDDKCKWKRWKCIDYVCRCQFSCLLTSLSPDDDDDRLGRNFIPISILHFHILNVCDYAGDDSHVNCDGNWLEMFGGSLWGMRMTENWLVKFVDKLNWTKILEIVFEIFWW